MSYTIAAEARIQGSVSALAGSNRPYSVVWAENRDLKGWTTFVNLDIVGAWNGFLFATKLSSSGGFIGPTDTFLPLDALLNDHIFFRLKYDKHPKNPNPTSYGKIQWTTSSDPLFDDSKSITFPLLADGKWHLYDIDMNQASQWVGLINKVRFFPCEDGYINDEFFLTFFEIGTNDFDFSLDNPNAGIPGKLIGGEPLPEEITITRDVNDRLLVNIDGYGYVSITLSEQTGTRRTIARDIAIQLGKISIGGYVRAQTSLDEETGKLIIESGTRDSDSSVSIMDGENSAAFTLGLTNSVGEFIGIMTPGSPPATDYVPLSDYRPKTIELLSLFDNDNVLPAFSLDPQTPALEGGRRNFGLSGQRLKTDIVIEGRNTTYQSQLVTAAGNLDGTAKTFIDLNHPFTDDGFLSYIRFNGVADPDGGTKWKIFRPHLDGTLSLVHEGIIGETNFTPNPSSGLVLTTSPGVFEVNVSTQNLKVRQGDLLAIYNAGFHVGQAGPAKPDALYYEISGDATGTITPPQPSGAGESGLPIYAVGFGTKGRCAIDIDLRRRLNLDSITIVAEESSRDLEYNVAAASSASFSADVASSHTVCRAVIIGDPCFERPNVAFNIQALNDDVIYAVNGVTSFGSPGAAGVGGANVEGATYFYVNGDEEQLGVYDFAGQQPRSYGFERDPLGLTCFFSSNTPRSDKPISKVAIYFKDRKNQRSWQLEYARSFGSKGGNGSIPGFQLIPPESLQAVTLDDSKRIERSPDIFLSQKGLRQDILLDNPVILDVIAQDGTRNPQQGVDFKRHVGELGGTNLREQATFIDFQWTKFQWEFDPVRTTALRWYTDYHFSTKISEFQIFASSPSQEDLGDNTQVLFSSDGQTFTSAELINASDTQASYKIGNSPQFLRLIFRPTLDLTLKDVQFRFEEDQVLFGPEGRTGSYTYLDDSRVGSFGAVNVVPITNNTGEQADLLLDISPDVETAKQLLYFSHLHEPEDITTPQVGPPGRVDFVGDKQLGEEENVAINAKAYGLNNLSTASPNTITDNLLISGAFETGDLTGWNLTVTQSGTKRYQIPRVMNVAGPANLADEGANPDESITPEFQGGSYLFGFELDSEIPEQIVPGVDEVPIHFTLETAVIDVSEFAESIDVGSAEVEMSFRYMAYFTPNDATYPLLNIMGSPTTSGLSLSENSTVDSSYGTNRLRSRQLVQGTNISTQSDGSQQISVTSWKASIKQGTRYIKAQFVVNADSARVSGSRRVEKFFLDDVDLRLILPSPEGVKWYKSWRTGSGDFTDSQYLPVAEFTTITGSTHWYQPWSNSAGAVPISGQTLGYSDVFTGNRLRGAQSFRRMSISDPGILGAQWSGEKVIAGFRAVLNHNTNSPAGLSCAYPRRWHVEVLKTKIELGGIDPDLNNETHFKQVMVYTNTGPWDGSSSTLRAETTSSFTAPAGLILTWLFDTPQTTEGIRIVLTTNCDRFEIPPFDTNSNGSIGVTEFAAFTLASTCPDNGSSPNTFFCSDAIGASFFQPLESVGIDTLPVDNVRIANRTGNVFAAVDLGRRHNINTDGGLFELVAQTASQSEWGVNLVSFSNTDTDDPNSVIWGGGSADARWIRFGTAATEKYENPASLEKSSFISNSSPAVIDIPQSSLTEARIYPVLTQYLIPLDGYNSSWTPLGTVITDNNNLTSISYRDYPVIALDLGKSYLLSNESTVFRAKHDLVTPTSLSSGDRQYWNPDDDSNFTYAKRAFANEDNPARVEFLPFGAATPPDIAIRWVAFKGAFPLQKAGDSGAKSYNIYSKGQILYNTAWRPRGTEVFTENSNWFSTNRVGLVDVSTFDTSRSSFTATKGVDYGPLDGRDFIGDVYNAFDGEFSEADGDIWGVSTRDPVSGIDKASLNFPHYIFRTFRDSFRGSFPAKDVKGIKITGFNSLYYPTAFHVQKLKDSVFLPSAVSSTTRAAVTERLRLSTSWETIADSTVTDVDTYQNGAGYFLLFPVPVNTRGVRIVIDASEYPDDTDQTIAQDDDVSGTEIRGSKTFTNVSGPQTRVAEVVIYEEIADIPAIEGQLDINQASSATITTLTQVPDKNPSRMIDNRLSTDWQSTGFQDTITIALPEARDIHRLEWELDPSIGELSGDSNKNAPRNFKLTAQQGPLEVTVLNVVDFVGTSYSGDLLNAPVNSNLFKLYITRVQGESLDSDSIQISELRLIEEVIQSTPLVVVEDVTDRHPDSSPNVRSTLIRYAANTDAEANVFLDGIDANNDALWSERDFFQLYIKINDISLLDTNYGTISLGNSPDVLYQWNISDIPNLHSGWNKVRLQFKSAGNRTEIPFQGGPKFDPYFGDSKVDFMTSDSEFITSVHGVTGVHVVQSPGIRYFSFAFRGTKSVPDKELEITLDDFQFSRNRFDDVCKFQPSLYLNNSETMVVNLEGLDMSIGTLEFWIQPDWDKSARIRSRPAAFNNVIIPTIFRILRPDGTFLSLFYRPSTGFVCMIYDGLQLLQFENDNTGFTLDRFEPFHFALVWDTINLQAGISASSLAMYKDGVPIYGSARTWRSLKQSGSTILFGGEMGQRVAASPHNSTALTFTAVPTLPAKGTASAWALLENVKMYNYPKINFDDRFEEELPRTNIISPSELIQISTDGINFESVGSINLPLVVEDVPNGSAVNLYMRSNLPKNLTGEESRDASIIVRWKTPLRVCD